MKADLTTRRILFFCLLYILFYLSVKLDMYAKDRGFIKAYPDLRVLAVGLVFIGIAVFIYYISRISEVKDEYRMLEISQGALCRGGPYMWQGNSEQAKMCRALAETPEGRCKIAAFNCPTGFDGMPKVPMDYSSDSDSNWTGVKCSGTVPDSSGKKKCDWTNSICSTVVGEY